MVGGSSLQGSDYLTEDNDKNPWLWEDNDALLVVDLADAFVRNVAGTPSVFTVSNDGKKVNFTDGNLQYMMPKQVYSLTVHLVRFVK